MGAVNKHVVGCTACVTATPNHTVTVKDCAGLNEAGAVVTIRRTSDSVVVGTCTSPANGQCQFTLPVSVNYTTTVESATYTVSESFFKSSFPSSQTLGHPRCGCLNLTQALALTDPWGTLAMANGSAVRVVTVQGVATPSDIPIVALPSQCLPQTEGYDCNGAILSQIQARIEYRLNCFINNFTAHTSVRLQLTYTACGAGGAASPCNLTTATPVYAQDAAGGIRFEWQVSQGGTERVNWHYYSQNSDLSLCNPPVDCRLPVDLSFPLDFGAFGQGLFPVTVTPP
jgi:hypothetical protein